MHGETMWNVYVESLSSQLQNTIINYQMIKLQNIGYVKIL